MSNVKCDRCEKEFDRREVEWIRHPVFIEIVCPDCKRRHDVAVAQTEGK